MAAATTLIAERGYWALSMQDVADSCGLTVTGLLHHVGSKTGLLVEVLRHRDEADASALAGALGVESPPDGPSRREHLLNLFQRSGASLANLCAALVEHNTTQPEVVRLYSVLGAESLDPTHPAHGYFAERQQITLEGLAQQAPPGVDATSLARHVLAAMDGLQLQWLRDPKLDLVAEWSRLAAAIPDLAGR